MINDLERNLQLVSPGGLSDDGLPSPSLKKNFLWTLLGNMVYAGCQWGMLIILAKLTNTENVGKFALAFAITAPVIMLANLQLRGIQATDSNREYLFGEYLGLRIIMLLLSFLAILSIVLFMGRSLEVVLIILIVGVAKSFESLSDVFYGLLQSHERMDRISKSMIIKGILSLGIFGILVYLTKSTLWGVVGLAIVWGLVFLSYDIYSGAVIANVSITQIIQPKWKRKRLIKLALFAFPMGIVMVLVSLNANIPRYFIERLLGKGELGIFAALAYLMTAGNMVILALGQSSVPRMAKYYAKGEADNFKKLIFNLVGIAIIFGLTGLVLSFGLGRQLLLIFYKPEYAKHVDVLILLMFAAAINYIASFLGFGMTAARYFKIQASLFMICTFCNLLLCFYFVPQYGLIGGALAITITSFIQLTGSLLIINYALKRISHLKI